MAAETYPCELYQGEDVIWNQNLADNLKSETKYPRPSPVSLILREALPFNNIQSTLDTSNFKGLGKICRVISSSR